MSFDYTGGLSWGTDEIAPTASDYNSHDIFVTPKKIKQELYPTKKYPEPEVKMVAKLPVEAFHGGVENVEHLRITENMLIIMLLVILVVICGCMHSCAKHNSETMKLIVALLIQSKKP
jgi:hypothetical protein